MVRYVINRVGKCDVGSYLKLGGQVLSNVGGHNLPPLVDKVLIDLLKPGWEMPNLPAHLLRHFDTCILNISALCLLLMIKKH